MHERDAAGKRNAARACTAIGLACHPGNAGLEVMWPMEEHLCAGQGVSTPSCS